MVPKIGRRRSDGPVLRLRFCGENVGRSFVVCSHDPIFKTDKESSIWRQNDHRDIMQNLSAPFIFQEECQVKIEHALFPSVFFTFMDPCVGRSFSVCSHDPIFGTNKNRILENGQCERAIETQLSLTTNEIQYKVDWIVQATMTPSAYARFQFSGGFGRSRGPAFHIYNKKQ